MRNCLSKSTTWRLKKRTTAALRTLFRQLHAFLTAPQLCINRVHFQALPSCVHRISYSLQFSFHSGFSTPRDHQISGPHFPCSADHEQDWQPHPVDPYSAICDDHTYIHTYMMAVANAASTSSTLLSPGRFALRCLPIAAAPSCRTWGSVTRRLRFTGGLAGA